MTDLRLFTSESVTEGHPDKICDQISDSILDALLTVDRDSRVAVETLVTTGLVHVAGEVRTEGYVDIPGIVRGVVNRIGYTSSDTRCDGVSRGVPVSIGEQSGDIAHGVDRALEHREEGSADPRDAQGAGDQGIMFGYATNETPQLMPAAIATAHRIAERLATARKTGALPFLRPDGKTQVTLGYEGNVPRTVEAVVLSTQHQPDISAAALRAAVRAEVIEPVLAETGLSMADTEYFINPAGPFVIGGPKGDAGLPGRRILIAPCGGASRHGGGAFSGKDPSKVDRSAAYAMRWVAKNAVAAGLADRLEVQVAYAIGRAAPVGLYVETFGTGVVENDVITRAIREVFDLRPTAIIDELDLLRPIYAQTAAYGHFGRELPDFTWGRLDRVGGWRAAAGL